MSCLGHWRAVKGELRSHSTYRRHGVKWNALAFHLTDCLSRLKQPAQAGRRCWQCVLFVAVNSFARIYTWGSFLILSPRKWTVHVGGPSTYVDRPCRWTSCLSLP